jgi:hypothetical protein
VWDKGNLFEEGGDAWFKTRAGVGLDDINGEFDVAKTETLLDQAGVLDLADTKGPTGIFSYGKLDAIKDFQAKNALKVDGRIAPNGETMRTLKTQLTPKLNALAAAAKAAKAEKAAEAEKAAKDAQEKPDPVQVADNSRYSLVTSDAQLTGLLGGSNQDPHDRLPRKEDQPDKQVAALPVLVAAAPVIARAVPWAIKGFKAVGQAVLGATGVAVVGSQLSGRTAEDGNSGKREMLPPEKMPPNHTGGDQLPPEDMKNNTESYPAIDPVDLKKLTQIPGFTPSDIENVIEIFPVDSGIRLPIIIESRGNEWTQEQNTRIAETVVRWSIYRDRGLEHIGGAFDGDGTRHTEHYLKNRITDSRKGSSRLDITLKNEKTGRLLHINTIDVKADGGTPSTDFSNADLRGADLRSEYMSNSNLQGSDLRGAKFSSVTLLTGADVNGAKINRYDLECLGDYGGLTQGDRMQMEIEDGVALLRSSYSGFLQWFHLIALAAFLFPYAYFVIIQWSEARFLAAPDGTWIPLWKALGSFIFNGGVDWHLGYNMHWSFVAFVFLLVYNILRAVLL